MRDCVETGEIGIAILDTSLSDALLEERPGISSMIQPEHGYVSARLQQEDHSSAMEVKEITLQRIGVEFPTHGSIITEIIHRYAHFAKIRIYYYGVLDISGRASNANICEALEKVKKNDAVHIVSMSLQMQEYSDEMRRLLNEIGNNKVVIAAAGNDMYQGLSSAYPAQNAQVIPVGAIDFEYTCEAADVHIKCPSAGAVAHNCTSFAAAHATAYAAVALRIAYLMDMNDNEKTSKEKVDDASLLRLVSAFLGKLNIDKLKGALNVDPQPIPGDKYHRFHILSNIVQECPNPLSTSTLHQMLTENGIRVSENTDSCLHALCWEAVNSCEAVEFEEIAKNLKVRLSPVYALESAKDREARAYTEIRTSLQEVTNISASMSGVFRLFKEWISGKDKDVTAFNLCLMMRKVISDLRLGDQEHQRCKDALLGTPKMDVMRHTEHMNKLLMAISESTSGQYKVPFPKYMKNDCKLLKENITKIAHYNRMRKDRY